jgi:hypothetical protein
VASREQERGRNAGGGSRGRPRGRVDGSACVLSLVDLCVSRRRVSAPWGLEGSIFCRRYVLFGGSSQWGMSYWGGRDLLTRLPQVSGGGAVCGGVGGLRLGRFVASFWVWASAVEGFIVSSPPRRLWGTHLGVVSMAVSGGDSGVRWRVLVLALLLLFLAPGPT